MQARPPALLFWPVLRGIFGGELALRNGHLPPAGHDIPGDFAGVGVAGSADPAVQAAVMEHLRALGIRQVRVDISYGDLDNHVARLLDQLLERGYRVMLHLVQPFEAARAMHTPDARDAWRGFAGTVMQGYGKRVAMVEAGSTINRKRWAGYDVQGFFAMWEIAWQEARRHGVTLAGPNITDFEPLYTLAILSRLEQLGQLPDIHTDNLFSERVTEPERDDHRILGLRAATRLRVNLVKKARLLQGIGAARGVPQLISPAAFWTLPRIERVLPDGEQKQADYLARYFILCAASGALRQAFWGPLVCAREGLVDDATAGYPALERITHYKEAAGEPSAYRRRPAFAALRTFAQFIPGTCYEGALSSANGLEIHAFRSGERLLHAVWTANGRALPLAEIYRGADLQAAVAVSRDGEALERLPDFATETPVYLIWPLSPIPTPALPLKGRGNTAGHTLLPPLQGEGWGGDGVTRKLSFISLHRHMSGTHYYTLDIPGWRGALAAANPAEAALLRSALTPDCLPQPARETLLRKARNAIWVIPDPRDPAKKLVAKQPLSMHPHKRLLDRFKPSKAQRSWNAAGELLRRGIATPLPVAWLEQEGDSTLTRNIYVCEYYPADFSAREMFDAYARGEAQFQGIAARDAYRQIAAFLLELHGKGVYFRDLSGGNILMRKQGQDGLEFSLIDINRARFHNHALPLSQRLADLARVCNKLHWAGREILLGHYLQALRRKLGWRRKLPFYLYDLKVSLKRNFGRKALKRLLGK